MHCQPLPIRCQQHPPFEATKNVSNHAQMSQKHYFASIHFIFVKIVFCFSSQTHEYLCLKEGLPQFVCVCVYWGLQVCSFQGWYSASVVSALILLRCSWPFPSCSWYNLGYHSLSHKRTELGKWRRNILMKHLHLIDQSSVSCSTLTVNSRGTWICSGFRKEGERLVENRC